MKILKSGDWKKYTFEFLSIFVAVITAFSLNNWNDHRRDRVAERKILREISNGFMQDLEDLKLNRFGHGKGINACNYWIALAKGDTVSTDSLMLFYFVLTRDFFSLQNNSGYESLKSRGLEIITDDSLRYEIISIYEYDFSVIRKFEEEYMEMQFHSSYFMKLNELFSPYVIFDNNGQPSDLIQPMEFTERQKQELISILYRIRMNRELMVGYYATLEERVLRVKGKIDQSLEQ